MSGLTIKGVGKQFGSFVALDQINVEFHLGELCGLAGHNGAGKSTLMNILSGAIAPSSGTIELQGQAYRPRSYRDATRTGVFRVSQELTLFDNLPVLDNIIFGLEDVYTRAAFLRRRQMREDVKGFLDQIGLTVLSLSARVGDLPLALKQLTEIARCLFAAFKHGITEPVLLFDEPTSGLTHSQAEFVGQNLRRLSARAIIILTSHRGKELLDLSSRVIVLRAGQLVADQPSEGLSPQQLEELMTGVTRIHHVRAASRDFGDAAVVLNVNHPGDKEPITVRKGEVVGLYGEGEGKSRLLAAIAGWKKNKDVAVLVEGRDAGSSTHVRASHGIRYVPGERAREGFSVWQPITWNVTAPHLARDERYRSFPTFPGRETGFVNALVKTFGVRVPDVHGPIASLSGGNQQRLLVARMLDDDAKVLLCDRPTRGVDVTATAEVHAAIRRAAETGIACLVASDEREELEELCDRIIPFDEP